jgi:hypothetical protein
LGRQKQSKGIGNRSVAGNGATWVGNRPRVPPPCAQRKERAGRQELPPLQSDLPDGILRRPSGWLSQIGDLALEAGRFLARKLLRPFGRAVAGRWRAVRAKIGIEERLIDSDTYEPGRARDWEKFQQGKRSTSYLQDDESDHEK